ncbi:putative quinol monooxygenase [Pseudomonas sp. SH1-B]
MHIPLSLIATINVLPGHTEAVAAGLRELVTASNAEPGCLRYELHGNPGNPEQFVMIEQWRDEQALELHRNAPHFQHFTSTFGERLSGIELLPLHRLA